MLVLPTPRGPVSTLLIDALREPLHALPDVDPWPTPDPLVDEDLQLSLYLCYELHYRGLPGVDPDWEWEPSLLALRRQLELRFEADLRAVVPACDEPPAATEVDRALRAVADADDGVSLSRYLQREGTEAQLFEFLIHRSAYQLKEADPHSWALPRLSGRPKAALVEIQADEYGGGDPQRNHAALFAKTLDALGLDSRYGAYVDVLPAVTLATVNLMSLFGLHRRLLGAIVGHLALFEMTSSVPNRRYGDALRRLGHDEADATDFFDEHVEADAVHESIAAVDLAGGLAAQQTELTADIIWGARALVEVEARWSAHLVGCWHEGRSSLRGGQDGVRRRSSAALGARNATS